LFFFFFFLESGKVAKSLLLLNYTF